MGKKKEQEIGIFVYLMLVTVVLVTICSHNSFLYPVNAKDDIHCFFTTAKCILHGKVLYRDVYEHKGLYLYLIYAVAYFISNTSFFGVYIMECVFGTVYLYGLYKIARLYIDKPAVCVAMSTLTGIFTYTWKIFFEGGYCEEFTLPIITVAMYIVLKHFCNNPNDKVPWVKVVLLGIFTAILMWMKYSVLGLFAGIIIYMIIICIKDKKYNWLFQYMGQFIAGFFIGSLPLIIYFWVNNAFKDLFRVYFYNLLFLYGDVNNSFVGNNLEMLFEGLYLNRLFYGSNELLIVLLFMIFGKNKNRRMHFAMISMFVGSASFLIGAIVNSYQSLILAPFYLFGIIFLYQIIVFLMKFDYEKAGSYIKRLKLYDTYNKMDSAFKNMLFLVCMSVAIFFLEIVNENGLFKALWQIGFVILVYKMCKFINNHIEAVKLSCVKEYIVLILLWVVVHRMVLVLFSYVIPVLFDRALIIVFLYFLYRDRQIIKDKLSVIVDRLVRQFAFIQEKIFARISFILLSLVMVGVIAFFTSGNVGYMKWTEEMVPQYRFAQYIKEQGKENPVIYGYNCCDSYVYLWLNSEPDMKYSAYYCIKFKELDDAIEHYVFDANADYVVSRTELDDVSGLRLVDWGEMYTDKRLTLSDFVNASYIGGGTKVYLYERIE
ncbi:MAG: hypothetical protein ACI4E1_13810 [Lachnospira sp.]